MVNTVWQLSLPQLALWTADILSPVRKGFYCDTMELIKVLALELLQSTFLTAALKEHLKFLLFLFYWSFLIWFGIIYSSILALATHTQRTKTSTLTDSGGQTCFLLLTSLQTSGTEALPADVQPASLIFSQGILAELNTIRQSNYPLGSLAYFLPPPISPLSLHLSLPLSWGSVSK